MSRIWRSLLDGREVLQQGLIRRIGSGETTSIWISMDWLPTDDMRRPVPSSAPHPPQLVRELIDHTSATWDTTKLHEFFTQADREAIMAIPLCNRRQPDFWAWHYDRKGIFTVRSAYRMLITRRVLMENAGRSNSREQEKEWSSLWQIQVPSKIRVFLWRLARHSLPSADVLQRRNMADHNTCALCGALDSWRHSLL